jgi:hypothetical protein
MRLALIQLTRADSLGPELGHRRPSHEVIFFAQGSVPNGRACGGEMERINIAEKFGRFSEQW